MNSLTIVTYVNKNTNLDKDSLINFLSLSNNKIIFCDSDHYNDFLVIKNEHFTNNNNILLYEVKLDNLEVYAQHKSVLLNKKDNLFVDFNKLSFIRSLSRKNPFKSTHFVWLNFKNYNNFNFNNKSLLTDKIVHFKVGNKISTDCFIVPQSHSWYYRFLVNNEFINNINKNIDPLEEEIYYKISDQHNDLFQIIETENPFNVINQSIDLNLIDKKVSNKIKVIIAKYDEDTSWAKNLNYEYLIYNKNEKDIGLFDIDLPNVGRESHTYLTYIIDNYDNLPEYICFLHGVPYDHCLDVVDKINNFNFNDNFLALGGVYYLHNSQWDRTFEFADKIGLKYNKEKTKMIASCQSIVSKELILQTPKKIYENIVNELSYSVGPPEGYLVENLWPTIFNFNDELEVGGHHCRGYWGGY
jgi:hypothetical protein